MPQLTLIIGNKNYSSWSLRPWIFMKQLGVEFQEKRIPLFTETTDQQLAPYFSDFKVPVLLDGDFAVWDSLAIVEYVSENYLDSKGWPADQKARALARSMSAVMPSSFADVRSEMPMNCRKKLARHTLSAVANRQVQRIKDMWHRAKTQYGTEGDWLFGEFCIADAMFAPVASRFRTYGVALEGPARDYADAVLSLPAMREWAAAAETECWIIEAEEVGGPAL